MQRKGVLYLHTRPMVEHYASDIWDAAMQAGFQSPTAECRALQPRVAALGRATCVRTRMGITGDHPMGNRNRDPGAACAVET